MVTETDSARDLVAAMGLATGLVLETDSGMGPVTAPGLEMVQGMGLETDQVMAKDRDSGTGMDWIHRHY